MSEAAYCRVAADLMVAVTEAFQKPRLLPAFLLFYTSIDVISSLTRPIVKPDTDGEIFKRWVDDYMLPDSGLSCRSEEVWAARCGFLHTLTVESKLSREGRARRLHYANSKEAAAYGQKKIDPPAEHHLFIVLGDYVSAFIAGVERFSVRIQTEPELQAVVYHHATKLVVQEE